MPSNPLGALPALPLGAVGEYIREQRRNAQYSVRQLAQAAGVSNPYLSQIERGLRKPSAEILQQLAKALQISAESLYVKAGLLDGDRSADAAVVDGIVVEGRPLRDVRAAIADDAYLTVRQKRALLDIYEAFRNENAADTGDGADQASRTAPPQTAQATDPTRPSPESTPKP
jgi:transcriptional regulator with XRE-family HTH domain